MRQLKIVGVHVFLEKRKTRLYVGTLRKELDKLVFTYDERYFRAKNIIPLGPEFPLTQKQFISDRLFPSLQDRIPSLQNPAYSEYCKAMEIDSQERDPLILLSTIGRQGPSSFLFYPIFERTLTAQDLVKFRKSLGFTTREFAAVFEFSQTTLNAFEKSRIAGHEITKRLEILIYFPEVALDLLRMNAGYLVHAKWRQAIKTLSSRLDSVINQ